MTVVFVGTVNWSKLISSLNNSTARPPPRCLPGDLAAFPRGDPATWLVAGTTTAGVVATTILRLSCHCLQRGLQIHRWRAMEWLSKSVYVSEQACIGWCRTGAYYTAKLTVSHDFPIEVWGAYYTSVRIIFKFLRYLQKFSSGSSGGR